MEKLSLSLTWKHRRMGKSSIAPSPPFSFLQASIIVALVCVKASSLHSTEIPILIPQKHPVIDEIVDGINAGFKELGYESPDVRIILMDGQGVPANFSTIIDAAIQKHPPLIITITTGLSKLTVDKVVGSIPVVFSGVTDPVGSKIIPDLVQHGKVTGASDLWPIKEQLGLIRRILPNANSVGVMFRPSEANSQFGMRIVRDATQKFNLELVERGVEDSRDIIAVLDAILPQVDAIYIGPDNMTIEAAKVIVESSINARKPVFGGETGTFEKGAVGVISIPYFDLGRETAKICNKILSGTPIEQVPVYVAEEGFLGLNYEAAARLSLSIPQEVRQAATKTIGIYTEPSPAEGPANIWLLVVSILFVCGLAAVSWFKKMHKTHN